MKPLRELDDYASEAERALAQLFSAAERYQPNPLRKRRTGVLLGGRARPVARRRWQPLLAAALLVAGTSAAAALGQRWLGQEHEDQPPRQPVYTQVVPKTTLARPLSIAPVPNEGVATEQEVATAPGAGAQVIARETRPQQAASPPLKKARRPGAGGEDPTRVAEALRELRKEGNAGRAQALLSEYLQANPDGALSEEALALTIEAAHTRRDPKAKDYARRYLSRYPSGRHRALATRVLND